MGDDGNLLGGDVVGLDEHVPSAARHGDDASRASDVTFEDAPLVVAAADGVLANDADPDGDPLTAAIVDEPTNGEVELADSPLLDESVVVVVGSEGDGLARLTREACDAVVRLPMRGRVGSLNASVAAAVAMYEVLRRHGTARPAGR